MTAFNYDFAITRQPGAKTFALWRVNLDDPEVFTSWMSSGSAFDGDTNLTPLGDYILEWGRSKDFATSFVYRLWAFDPSLSNPLGDAPVTEGLWDEKKMFYGRLDFGHYDNKQQHGFIAGKMELVPVGNFLLSWLPKPGRGTYRLWNFDPGSEDPIPVAMTPENAWGWIELGHKLIGVRDYVIDWVPATGAYKLWSFDPQARQTLKLPWLNEGVWEDIGEDRRLIAIGDLILDYAPETGDFRLWRFDPDADNPLGAAPVRTGVLPKGFEPEMEIIGVQPKRPVNERAAAQPGTIDFMRSKIKHIVYYMVENRSFDHVCGWLYNDEHKPAHIIGAEGPFDGASLENRNIAPDGKMIATSVYKDGETGEHIKLELLPDDPHHDFSDVMRQLYHPDMTSYARGDTPTMGGFVMNNGYPQVMETYAPQQLPVLSGLATNFAISDRWFCSMPGGTDVNRAFSLTGSSLCTLNNFQNGVEYEYWPYSSHRPSIWKVLWTNGVTDWKIYNSIEWLDFVFSYHLFLRGQIPSVDAAIDKARSLDEPTPHLGHIEDLKKEALAGTLPAFSFVEPVWIANTGTTSYHPGADLVPGETALNDLYNALKAGPNWNETLLVITFDEHGGIYDHTPPPRAKNPWPNDVNDGFHFDVMGVRVPTILVSPMIEEKTVFRAEGDTDYEATSFLATLLQWFGVPQARWGLGERTHNSPTFEAVVTRAKARAEMPTFTPPVDSDHPPSGGWPKDQEANDLHRLMAQRMVEVAGAGILSETELRAAVQRIAHKPDTLVELHANVAEFMREIS